MYQPVANAGAEAQQVACSNSMMDITMPLMSTFFTFMVPALVGVYWIFRSFVGLLKQFIISKVMPLPVFTEEDYKAAEREMKSKQSSHVNKSNSGKTRAVRSLHYIDDEDFEDTRERGLARKAAIEEKERAEQEKNEQKKALFSAPMKEDREEKNTEAEAKEADSAQKDTDNKTEE
jgi:YidC/Oxa1 family membrane protein insertase